MKHRYRTVHFHIHRYSVQLTRTNVNIATSLDTGPSAAEKKKADERRQKDRSQKRAGMAIIQRRPRSKKQIQKSRQTG